MATAEETRAQLFRDEMAARARARAANRRTLKGSSSARFALRDRWRPVSDPQPVVVEPISTNDPVTNLD